MATLELEYKQGTMVYEADAGAGRWLGAVDVRSREGGFEVDKSVVGFSTLDRKGRGASVVELSNEYEAGTFDGMDAAEVWRFLNRREGLLAVRLNGSTVWSLAAELAAKAKDEVSEANEAERKAERDAKAEADRETEREFVRTWIANHPEVTDVSAIAKQTGSSKAVVRAVILDGQQTA